MKCTVWDIEYTLKVFNEHVGWLRGDVMRVALPTRSIPSVNDLPVAHCKYREVVFRKNWNTNQ